MITNHQSGTTIDEIEDGIYRISTPVPPEMFEGGFTFNQYLLVDEEPLLFHTGPRAMFPLVSEAIGAVMPVEQLRWISFGHVESDECGSLNQFLAVAPQALPLCSRVAAMVSVGDLADRPPRALADDETMSIGRKTIRWIDAPHVPHNWENGFIFEETSRTFLCGDLFTHGGDKVEPLTAGDILGAAEQFRHAGVDSGMPDAWSFAKGSRPLFDRFADLRPRTLALMHGSAWRDGSDDGAAGLLRALGDCVGA